MAHKSDTLQAMTRSMHALKLTFVSHFTFPKKLNPINTLLNHPLKCLLWTLYVYDGLVWMVVHDTVHTELASRVSSSMPGFEFLENFKTYLTKGVCVNHLSLVLRLMSLSHTYILPLWCAVGQLYQFPNWKLAELSKQHFLYFLIIQTLF